MRAPPRFLPLASGFAPLAGHHRALLDDAVRTRALMRAVERAVRPGDAVLDFGTGTGVLALAAARAGARVVYAVEAGPVARAAAALARANGVDDVVRVVRADGAAYTPPERVRVLVSECFGVLGVGGTMVSTLCALRDRALAPGGVVVPAGLAVRVAPVCAPAVERYVRGGYAPRYGARFDALAPWLRNNAYNVALAAGCLAAPAQTALALDLRADGYAGRFDATLRFVARRARTAHGLVAWFDARLVGALWLRTGPGRPRTVWGQAYLPLEEPLALRPGDALFVHLGAEPSRDRVRATELHWYVRHEPRDGRPARAFAQGTLRSDPTDPPPREPAPERAP